MYKSYHLIFFSVLKGFFIISVSSCQSVGTKHSLFTSYISNLPHVYYLRTCSFLATIGGYDLILHNMNSEKNNFTECAMDIRILFQNNVLV